MAQYKFIGTQPIVFVDIQLDDSSTLLAVPGETYELAVVPADARLVEVTSAPAPEAPAPTAPEAPVTAPEAPTTAPA